MATSSTPDGASRFTVVAEFLNGDPRPCFQGCPAQSLFLAVSFEVSRLKHSIIRVNGFLAWAHDSHSRYYFRCPHLPILTKPQGRCKRLDRVEGGDDFSRSHKMASSFMFQSQLHVHQLIIPVTFAIVMLMQSDFIIPSQQRFVSVFRGLLDAFARKIDKYF